jgi:hypothetical protein
MIVEAPIGFREGIGENVKRAVTVSLGRLASQAIGGKENSGNGHASSSAAEAIRCYLTAVATASGWSYPSFLAQRQRDEDVELSLRIDDGLWKSLEAEAGRQNVSTEQILEHAVLYSAAELDRGRRSSSSSSEPSRSSAISLGAGRS